MSELNCIYCGHTEISKMPNGRFYEPKADIVKKRKTEKKVNGRLCGGCTQFHLANKLPDIKWDNINEPKEISRPSRRRRRPERRRRR